LDTSTPGGGAIALTTGPDVESEQLASAVSSMLEKNAATILFTLHLVL
jgi:hypothetical protein